MIGGADASVVFGYVVATDSDGAEERGEIPPPSVDEMRFAARVLGVEPEEWTLHALADAYGQSTAWQDVSHGFRFTTAPHCTWRSPAALAVGVEVLVANSKAAHASAYDPVAYRAEWTEAVKRFAAALGWRSSALAWQAPAPTFVLVVAVE